MELRGRRQQQQPHRHDFRHDVLRAGPLGPLHFGQDHLPAPLPHGQAARLGPLLELGVFLIGDFGPGGSRS
jgi:hypothetical protein